MKSPKRKIVFFLSLLTLSGIIAGCTLRKPLGTATTNTATNISQPTNVAVNKPTVTANSNSAVDPTADWLTYQNKSYGFEVKYPGDLKASEEKIDASMLSADIGYIFVVRFESSEKENLKNYTVSVSGNQSNLSLREWIDRHQPNRNDEGSNAVIGSTEGILFQTNAMGNSIPNFYTSKNNKVFFFSGSEYNDEYREMITHFRSLD